MKTTMIAAAVFAVTASASLPAFAWEPFTVVTNVCETCVQAPGDVVTLSNGTKIRGQVVGENNDFWVVVRYTEARAIPKREVQSIEWANKTKPFEVTSTDQILLKNGVVLNGKIIQDKSKPPAMELKSSYLDQTFIVFKKEVAAAYRSGVKIDLGT